MPICLYSAYTENQIGKEKTPDILTKILNFPKIFKNYIIDTELTSRVKRKWHSIKLASVQSYSVTHTVVPSNLCS